MAKEGGICSGCVRWFTVNKDGTIRKHERGRGRFRFDTDPPEYIPNYCPGSGLPPRKRS